MIKPNYITPDGTVQLYAGDCLDVMRDIPDNSVDAILTDPPYGLRFMCKKWDYDVPSVEVWTEALRILKPGGHLLCFAGTRTQHRMACNIEDAGFVIRDMIAWVYGSGFPKSLDISKAIDKAAGAEREVVGEKQYASPGGNNDNFGVGNNSNNIHKRDLTAPATDEAKLWHGYGTALKPALEPITVAMKPLDGTFAHNALTHGVAGFNIDGCRIETDTNDPNHRPNPSPSNRGANSCFGSGGHDGDTLSPSGRFPANLIHDGSDEVMAVFPSPHGAGSKRDAGGWNSAGGWGFIGKGEHGGARHGDSGSAARFFYCAKASRSERNAGLEGFEEKQRDKSRKAGNPGGDNPRNRGVKPVANVHPTLKPIRLCEYLARLLLPPVQDKPRRICIPFAGSGSEMIGAHLAGWDEVIGVEISEEYCEIGRKRLAFWSQFGSYEAAMKAAKVKRIDAAAAQGKLDL